MGCFGSVFSSLHRPRKGLSVLFVLAFASVGAAEHAKGLEFFEAKIRPVLVEHCYECHAVGKKIKGQLLLDTRAGLLEGGSQGPAIVPGKANTSLLVKALRHNGDTQMPPKGKLPDKTIADFIAWIDMGAPDPRTAAPAAAKGIDWTEARRFWSFRPVKMPAVPDSKDGGATSAIDRFIQAKWAEKGLKPVPPANKPTWIRRATFDLTGLPPTPNEIEAFLNDDSPGAHATVIDRLLASPRYGESQARHWLDIARYAEDQAHSLGGRLYPHAYRYRDWVIDAFNADMPYDRFIKLQIAADLMEDGTPESIRHRAALGFMGLGAQYFKLSDAAKATVDELDDRVDTLTRGLLGLTVSCARCHDHKFDPVPTQDYYSIAGVYASSKLTDIALAPVKDPTAVRDLLLEVKAAEERIAEFLMGRKGVIISEKLSGLPAYLLAAWKLEARRLEKRDFPAAEIAKAEKLDAEALERLVKFLAGERKTPTFAEWFLRKPAKEGAAEPSEDMVATARALTDALKMLSRQQDDKAAATISALFGEKGVFPTTDAEAIGKLPAEAKKQFDQLKSKHAELVQLSRTAPPLAHGVTEGKPADMNVYVRGDPSKPGEIAPRRFLRILAGDTRSPFSKGSGRVELAEAIIDPANPLTARVFVNRIWQQHFGRGIVATPSNFGQLGERPTHPELLDYLAVRFVESGWSVKQLHREIMLSSAYRSSSASSPEGMRADPANHFLWRMNRRRLEVEPWRDSMLAVAGNLDSNAGGPTTNLDDPNSRRRTIYAKISRHELSGVLRMFDFPDANITSDRREETIVPQQQLFVMNNPFAVNQAKVFATRLQKEGKENRSRIERAYLLAYGRPPVEHEIELGLGFLGGSDPAREVPKNKLTRWERYAQILLASNEFLYID